MTVEKGSTMKSNETAGVSRRSFVSGASTIGATAILASAMGASQNVAHGAEALTASDVTWNQEVDVAVVGTGTAVFAAFAARDAGATSVALIEKSQGFGGTAAYSGGAFWAPNNSLMLGAGYEDSREDAIAYIKANAEGQTTDAIVETFVDAVPEFVDWVTESLGIEWGFLSGEPLYGPQSWMDYTDLEGCRAYGRSLTVAGSNVGETATSDSYGGPLMWKIIRGLVDSDDVIDLMLDTEASRLVIDETGQVVGVQCTSGDTTTTIKTRYGVVLGTGGFDFNAEWRTAFLRLPVFNTVSVPTNTGDAQRMGLEIGAALGNMQNYWGTPATIPPADVPQGEAVYDGSVFYNDMMTIFDSPLRRAKPNAIVVNRFGERFADESTSYHHFNRAFEGWDAGSAALRNVPAYFIGDATFYVNYLLPGTANDAQVGDVPEGTVVADTIEELAEKLGIDIDGLKKTLDEFNADARAGVDTRFHRGEYMFDRATGADFSGRTDIANPCLGPVETPPFYGYAYLPGMLGTSGGLVINEKGRVLTWAGEEIPRLYACGNCSAGIFGTGYPGAGSTVSAGAVMGWIGARDAMTLPPVE